MSAQMMIAIETRTCLLTLRCSARCISRARSTGIEVLARSSGGFGLGGGSFVDGGAASAVAGNLVRVLWVVLLDLLLRDIAAVKLVGLVHARRAVVLLRRLAAVAVCVVGCGLAGLCGEHAQAWHSGELAGVLEPHVLDLGVAGVGDRCRARRGTDESGADRGRGHERESDDGAAHVEHARRRGLTDGVR